MTLYPDDKRVATAETNISVLRTEQARGSSGDHPRDALGNVLPNSSRRLLHVLNERHPLWSLIPDVADFVDDLRHQGL